MKNIMNLIYVFMSIVIFFSVLQLLWDNWIFVIIALVVLLLILIILDKFLKRKKEEKQKGPVKLSKEFKKKYPIIIQYVPPKGINSAEAWLLYNWRVEPTDLTSLLYQWAYEGFIQIDNGSDSENMAKIVLKKLKELPADRPFFETDMFNSIFIGGKDTKVIFSSNQLKYALFLEDLRIHGMNKWWFEKRKIPLFVKILYILLFLFIILLVYIGSHLGLSTNTQFIIFLVLLILIAWMKYYIVEYEKIKFTDKWAELVSYIIWYKNFIKNCDEKQIKTLLDEDPLFFDRVLPYAIAFGLDTQFLNKVTPLVEDWNAKYLFWRKVSPLLSSDIVFWIYDSATFFGRLWKFLKCFFRV